MTYRPIGQYNKSKAGHPEQYFAERYTFIDYRGDLRVSPLSYWGYRNTVITASHDVLRTGGFTGAMLFKRVWVDDYAWITSGCILYNCHVGHHAIVSIGSVVCNMEILPYQVVAGNPAKVIAWYDLENKRWRRQEGIK